MALETPSTASDSIDYASVRPPSHRRRLAAPLVLGTAGLLIATFVGFQLLRRHQLSLPDPYNNPYTILSTGCLLSFFASWLMDLLVLLLLARHYRGAVAFIAWTVFVVAGAYVAGFVVGMIRFIVP